MSDFFSRLVRRTLAVEPLVRPDLPPLIAAASEKPNADAPNVGPSAAANVSAGKEIAGKAFGRGAELTQSVSEQRPILSRPTDARFSADQPVRAHARSTHPPSDISLDADRVLADASHVESDAPGIQSRSLIVQHEARPAADARQWDVPSDRPIVEGSGTMPPSVHVSIGRIEVRALTPAPNANAPERRPPARLSLEQYLRERNEGRR